MRVAAFDLSLTGTGWALYPGPSGSMEFGTIRPRMKDGMSRLDEIVSRVMAIADHAETLLFEDLSFGSNDPSAQERAGLAYLIRHRLWKEGQSFFLVAPSRLKKFVTGKGNAKKELMMLEVFKRFGHSPADNNAADAIGLAYIGMALSGAWTPTMQQQAEVLADIRKKYSIGVAA